MQGESFETFNITGGRDTNVYKHKFPYKNNKQYIWGVIYNF